MHRKQKGQRKAALLDLSLAAEMQCFQVRRLLPNLAQ